MGIKNADNSITVQNWTHVYMNFFDHKDVGKSPAVMSTSHESSCIMLARVIEIFSVCKHSHNICTLFFFVVPNVEFDTLKGNIIVVISSSCKYLQKQEYPEIEPYDHILCMYETHFYQI
jgi:hypothetical protein